MKPVGQLETLARNFAYTFVRLGGEIAIGIVLTPLLIRALGLETFGFLVAIGASGVLLTMTTQTIEQGIARELGFWLGRGDADRLNEVFSSAFVLQLMLGITLLIVGVVLTPLILDVLTVPAGLAGAGRVCLLLTFAQFAVGVVVSPFAGMIRAHQDLRLISMIQLFQKLAALLAVLIILVWPGNELVRFVTLQFASVFVLSAVYPWVAVGRYAEARPRLAHASRAATLSILRYGTLVFLNTLGAQLRRNGVTVFLNITFGNLATAAHGIGVRVSSLITQGFLAVRNVVLPAMTVNAGTGNSTSTARLVSLSSMIAFCLTLPVAMPLLTDTSALLELWLQHELPPMAAPFTQILVVSLLLTTLSQGHGLAMLADGRIGTFVAVGQLTMILSVAAFCFIASVMRWPAYSVLFGEVLGMTVVACVWQPLWVRHKLLNDNSGWLRYAVAPIVTAAAVSLLWATSLCSLLETGLLRAIAVGSATLLTCSVVFLGMGIVQPERRKLMDLAFQAVRR